MNTQKFDITDAWIANAIAELPGAELSYKAEWDAHVMKVGEKLFGLLGEDAQGRAILAMSSGMRQIHSQL